MSRLLLLAAILPLALACATTGAGPEPPVPRQDRYFLVSPLLGFPPRVGPTTQRRLQDAHADLLSTGDRTEASEVAQDLAKKNPDLAPADVLQAEADFLGGEFDRVLADLAPILQAYPDYVAAALVYGRSSEKLGNLVEALEAYTAVSDANELARSRVVDLTPRVAEILALRIEDALVKGQTLAAQEELERLQIWAPDEDRTLEVAVDVHRASGDTAGELAALRSLTRRHPEDRALEIRLAGLELEIGDPARGIRLIENLAERYPEDPEIAEQLVRARYLWRFQLLPTEVRELAEKAELNRGEYAVLLYWLFPEIRYGSTGSARIANDILEHPHREQIVRVVNSGILDVDSSLHRFEPYRSVSREQALAAMLRLLARAEPPFACLGGSVAPGSIREVCARAAACAVIEEESDCLPSAPVSGTDALEFTRLTQDLLSAR